MALVDRDFYSDPTTVGARPRIHVRRSRVATLAAQTGAPTLPFGTPVAWDKSANKFTVYTQPSDAAIYTITANATASTGGTFTVLINGMAIEAAFDVAAAALQTAINAVLLDAGVAFSVACVATTGTDLGDNSAVITMTFSENAGAPSVQLDTSDLGGNAHTLAATDAGTQLYDTDRIVGIVADVDGVVTSASGEVQFLFGYDADIHRDDINTATIRAVLGGSPSANELDTALKDPELRKLGIHVRGLAGVV